MKQANTRRGQTQAQCSVGQALPDNVRTQTSSSQKRKSFICPLTAPAYRPCGAGSAGILSLQGEGHSVRASSSPLRGKVGEARMRGYPLGFTLIEILVVVLIIGILGAIMLPQYQRAVLKSRFAALMPIAKSMADSNEAYYLEHGEYADNAEDLPVQGRRNYSDGTELEFGTTTSHAYVLATRNNDFPNKYIVYQKHSGQYPGEIHCEAAADNTQAQDVCKSFGATQDIGETLTPNYLTYVLFGTGNGVAPTGDNTENDEPDTPTCPDNSVCDEQGNVTGCATGYHSEGNACVETPPCPENSVCNEQGQVTGCSTGYKLSGNECVVWRTLTSSSCTSTSCTYDFGTDGYYEYELNANSTMSCYSYGDCGVGGTPDIYDRTKTLGADRMTVTFDENGNIQWFTVQADNKYLYYDGSGNFLGGHGGIDANGNACEAGSSSCYQANYRADGTIGQLSYGISSYNYNANGKNSSAPIKDVTPFTLTNENNSVQLGIVQELLSHPHTKCDLYPEIADCQTSN